MQDKILLETKNLAVGYPKNTLLEHLILQLYAGELVGLIGRNGTGKSTLLRTLAGLHPALNGHITLLNKDLNSLSPSQRAKNISIVLSNDDTASNTLTVGQVAALGRFPYTGFLGRLSKEDTTIIRNALEKVGLAHKADVPFGELSDGERQRTMIARALSQNTSILLLDEPTAHLDLHNKTALMLLLRGLAKDTGKAILLTSHDLELTLQTADKLWVLDQQKISRGVPEDLILNHRITEAFGNERFHFDEQTGGFRVNHPQKRSIRVSGDGETVLWTRRALQRNGYGISEQVSDWEVKCLGLHQWQLTGTDRNMDETADNIENLLYLLQVWETDRKE